MGVRESEGKVVLHRTIELPVCSLHAKLPNDNNAKHCYRVVVIVVAVRDCIEWIEVISIQPSVESIADIMAKYLVNVFIPCNLTRSKQPNASFSQRAAK